MFRFWQWLLYFCLFTQATAMEKSLQIIEALSYRDGMPIRLEIVDGKISKISRVEALPAADKSPVYIAPGWIDNQINGFIGVDFSAEGLTADDVRKATQALWAFGVTTYLPTVITGPLRRMKRNLAVLAQSLQDSLVAASVPGFHLEGPFISSEDGYRGAHTREWVLQPDRRALAELFRAAENKILQITLAPELEGALDVIDDCVARGIVVGLGHHNATAAQIKAAVAHGARIAVHLGNGCANLIHRHENPLWPQLAEDRLCASIIADGFHLPPATVKTFFRAKGVDRLLLTSDVTKWAGMPPGEYLWNDMKITLTAEGMIRLSEQNVLAGAALPLSKGIFNLLEFTDCSLSDAIQTVTVNPARLYGLDDRGELAVGKRADLVLFSLGENDLIIHRTIVAGKEVYVRDREKQD